MQNLYLYSLLATIAPFTFAQNFIPTVGSSTFPACAVSCPILLQVQTVCTPPNAVTSTQQYYDSCFCQAPPVADLYTTGETLCTSQCTAEADKQLLSTWFVNFCKAAGLVYTSGAIGAVSPATTLTTSTTSTSTAQQTNARQTYASSSSSNDYTSNGPWIKTHWQWIIMLLVLFFGLLGLGLGARWYKRRHDRQMEQKRAAMSGYPGTEGKKADRNSALSPGAWEPSQHTAPNKGYQYAPTSLAKIDENVSGDGPSKEKDNRASRIEVTEIQPVPPPVHSKSPKFPPS